MKRNVMLLAVLGLAGNLLAQDGGSAAQTNNPAEPPLRPLYRPWSLGIEGGTVGIIGMFGSWHFSDNLGLRAAADYAGWSTDGMSIGGTRYDVDVRILNEPLALDIYPWVKHSFRISVGLLFNQNELTGTASHTGITIIDGHPFPTDEVGRLSLKIHQQLVNPYLSIGGNFFYFDRAHHWGFGGELGVAYTGEPDVSLTRSGPPSPLIDSAVRKAQSRAQDYADQFRFWPVAKLMVNYSF